MCCPIGQAIRRVPESDDDTIIEAASDAETVVMETVDVNEYEPYKVQQFTQQLREAGHKGDINLYYDDDDGELYVLPEDNTCITCLKSGAGCGCLNQCHLYGPICKCTNE